jgi:hypothetical protein
MLHPATNLHWLEGLLARKAHGIMFSNIFRVHNKILLRLQENIGRCSKY